MNKKTSIKTENILENKGGGGGGGELNIVFKVPVSLSRESLYVVSVFSEQSRIFSKENHRFYGLRKIW